MVEPTDLEPVRDTLNVLQDLAEEGADPLGLGRPFKERIDDQSWSAFMEYGRQLHYLAGSVIFREGDVGDELYILLSGRVAVLKDKGDGQSALLAYRGPGDILGEMSAMSRVPRSATVIAAEDTDLLRVEGEQFRTLTSTVPGICRTMLFVLSERLRAADIARTSVVYEEQNLARQLRRRTTEAERLAELARLRQQTVDLIVHDLRSPLGVIRGCLDMLQDEMSEEFLQSSGEVVEIARRSTNRLLSMVEGLLGAARLEVLGIQLDQEAVDLVSLLRIAVDGLRAIARSADVELALDLPAELPKVPGDKAQLERVVGNLLDNAISYTPAGGRVVLAAVSTDTDVQVSVTDTGPGVLPEYREHIFERFSRVPGTEGRKSGFGLGLYYCRQVVQAHGGRIWVEPGSGGIGSHFAFVLPRSAERQS